ncbi:Transcriptional activator protein LuxR [Pigmentiphaga humi]|uniref:Transcriptional activator protein LuxR n=2 Tax=Pigmentiphaga humi TaxID=2478468 RepID=A0A3P4AZC2_9BURK|nr:Transcriptional activator protein LuxR [Pigmentiphaga humi]
MVVGALRALRPLMDASSFQEVGQVVRDFSRAFGAIHHALGIVERGPAQNTVHSLFEDEQGWCRAFRDSCRQLLRPQAPGVGGAIRTALHTVDDLPKGRVQEELRRLDAHSLLLLVAEMREPGDTAACFALLFERGRGAARLSWQRGLARLCHHAASLVLDACLRLEDPPQARTRLSAREAECLRWASVGKTSWETAHIIGVSERTVNFHLGNAFAKLNVNNKQAAVAQAILQGLL